jgi:alkyl hydroperoxide reductase subunit AhpC
MIRKSRTIAIAAALSFLTVFAVSARAQNKGSDFSLRAIDGEAVTGESLRGEVAVLAFGNTWLPLTRNQLEGVKKLGDDYSGRGVVVYWVSTDSESPKSKNYASDEQLRTLARKYKVTVLRDPDGVVSKKLGVDQLPSIVIFDKQGNIAGGGPIGGMDPTANLATQLSARLDKIL